MLILLCLAVAAMVTGKYTKDTAKAAYEAGHEPPGVAKARLRYEKGGAKVADSGRRKGRGAFRLWLASRWDRTWDGVRENGEAKTAAKRLWLETEGRDAKSAAWVHKQHAKLDVADAARDKWDHMRGVIDDAGLEKRRSERAVAVERERCHREAIGMHEQLKEYERQQEEAMQRALAQEAEALAEQAAENARHRDEPFEPIGMAQAIPKRPGVDPERPFGLKTAWGLNDLVTAPAGAVTDEAREHARKEITRRAEGSPGGPESDQESGGGTWGVPDRSDGPYRPPTMEELIKEPGDLYNGKPLAHLSDWYLEALRDAPDGLVDHEVWVAAVEEIERRKKEEGGEGAADGGTNPDPDGSDGGPVGDKGKTEAAAGPGPEGNDASSDTAAPGNGVSTDPGANVVGWKPVAPPQGPAKDTNTNSSNGNSAAGSTGGTGMHYSQWVRELGASGDTVGSYSRQMSALMDALGAWGAEVTGPSGAIANVLGRCEGEYRDLAGMVQHQGSQGQAAHDEAHWVRPDHRVMQG